MSIDDAERRFNESRTAIERVTEALARQGAMSAEEERAFTAWLMARLRQQDHDTISKFADNGLMSTYFAAVIMRSLKDYRAETGAPRTRPLDLTAVLETFGALARSPGASTVPAIDVRVTCAGVAVGTAVFQRSEGLEYADLVPTDAYAMIAWHAQEIGTSLSRRHYWPPHRGDFAEALAEQWSGPRLAFESERGRELAVSSIVVSEFTAPGAAASIRVIADFRPDLARVAALLASTARPDGGAQARPAA
jgi:hypothetical protein